MEGALLILLAALVSAQETPRSIPITGDRLTGLVLPVEPVEGVIRLEALRAWAWTVDDTKRLLLEGSVRVDIGDYEFNDDSAVVWINRIPSADGLINQVAAYFPDLENPTEASGLGVSGEDVLITGSAMGNVVLDVARLDRGSPPVHLGLIRKAEQRLAKHLTQVQRDPPPLAVVPQSERPEPPAEQRPQPGDPLHPPPDLVRDGEIELPPSSTGDGPPLFQSDGTFFFSWGAVTVLEDAGDETAIVATNSVVVQYVSNELDIEWSQLTLSSQRAVVFTEPGFVRNALEGRVSAESIRGIYLEGAVIANADGGRYTVRAPHVYYDVPGNRAIMLDAVLRTYDRDFRLPIYARARELRQIAANQWNAGQATVSTSEFYKPHFAVGARRVTVTQRPRRGGAAGAAPTAGTGGDGGGGGAVASDGTRATAAPAGQGPGDSIGGIFQGTGRASDDAAWTVAGARIGEGAGPGPGPGTSGGGGGGGGDEMFLDVQDMTMRFSDVPVAWWPRYRGTVREVPLKNIEGGYRNDLGAWILTTWNPFTLFGAEEPEGIDAELRLDGYTKRGPAAGWKMDYRDQALFGLLDFYGLHDDGVDRTSSGLDVNPATEWRGIALWEHTHKLGDRWDLQAQLSAISDETFVTSWRDRDFYNRREYETSVYLEYEGENSAFNALAKYNVNDFISNSWLLASRAYQVQKVPELTYRRYGDRLGWLTYSGETRLSRVRFAFQTGTPAELGVPGAAFGLPSNGNIEQAFEAAGFPTTYYGRFDSRHEFALPVKLGFMNIVPYTVGRLTAYTDDFREFNGTTESTRVFGAVGVRMAGQLQTVDNTVESRLFDLHRTRTILEPRVTAWYGASTMDLGQLPVYDQQVEAIGGASVVELGLNTKLQTQRGGPGRWRSVDVIDLDLAVIHNSSDANRTTPIPRYFAYRPEQSVFGSHVFGAVEWTLSDQLAVVGESRYDLDNGDIAMGSIGTSLQHSPELVTFIEYRYLQPSNNRLLGIGWTYELSSKYAVNIRPQWDFVANDFRAIGIVVVRRFPDFNLSVSLRRDEIADQTSFGASLDLVEF